MLGRAALETLLESCLLLLYGRLFRHLLLLSSTFGYVRLQILHVDLAIVMVRLMLVNVVTVDAGELLKYLTLMGTPHFFLVVALLNTVAYLLLQLLLHLTRHIRFLLHEHGHAVHVVLFLVESELIEALRLALLIIELLSRLFLLDLLLGLLELLIDRFEHVLLLFSGFLFLFLWVHFEKLVRYIQQTP